MKKKHPHPLDYIFHPRSVAVAGVSSRQRLWGGGEMYVRALQAAEFPGPIYPLNPNAQEVHGLQCYPSLLDVPGPVDYVISSIPWKGVKELVEHAAAKGVRAIHFFTAGFRETGEEARIELEQQILARARQAGIRLIGPNCMGLYVPSASLSWNTNFPKEEGSVTLVSQSGLNAGELVTYSVLRGIRFSKVISYGNATDLDESDFFEYCTVDPETKIIISYVEGVKDGPRFLRALRAASAAKPTILLKGGVTAAGTRAAHSHTGSLAGSAQVWEALCRQTQVLSVDSLEELEDLAATFLFLKRPAGRGVAVVVVGGGTSVLAADVAEKVGLNVPPLSPELQKELLEFTPLEGSSVRNPLDAAMALRSRKSFLKMMRLLGDAPDIHVVVILMRIDWGARPGQEPKVFVQQAAETVAQAARETETPIAVAVRPPSSVQEMEMLLNFQEQCARAGLAVYPDIARALAAISKFASWHEERDRS
jgi:acyl-CoA synthetase (NDP forming)